MAITVPLPGLIDIRQPILGDSFGWAGTEPTAAKKSIVFHHSAAANAPGEDGFTAAEYHVNHNGWGGIGYHFFITRQDYPGRPGFTPAGAQIQYVGDLGTWRAHVLDQNPGRVGVCFAGMEPDEAQLRLGRQLMEFLVAPNEILPSINFMSQATVHQLVPGQSTECPGTTFPTWLPYLQGGAWPYGVPAPIIEPVPETPVDLTPGKGGGIPEYESTYRTAPEQRPVLRDGAHGINAITGETVVPNIAVGTTIDVAGYFTYQGVTYARTVYSASHNVWNGLDVTYFDAPTGQPSGDIPVILRNTMPSIPGAAPISLADEVSANVTDAQFQAAVVPNPSKLTVVEWIKELLASIFAGLLKKGSK